MDVFNRLGRLCLAGIVCAYRGAVIRTMHATGIFTDLGIDIGHLLRRLPVDMLRLRVCVVVAGAFMLGSAAGAVLFRLMRERTLLIPAVLTGLCGVSYGVYRQYTMTKRISLGADLNTTSLRR